MRPQYSLRGNVQAVGGEWTVAGNKLEDYLQRIGEGHAVHVLISVVPDEDRNDTDMADLPKFDPDVTTAMAEGIVI